MDTTHRARTVQSALAGLACLALLLTACATADQHASGPTARPGSEGPKTLRLAFREEPTAIHGGSSGTPEREVGDLLNAGLTYFDPAGNLQPKLAQKLPSIADGDWVVAPNGSMEVTWKLRPGLVWHDGAPLTAEDLAFAFRVFKDRDWPLAIPTQVRLMSEATALDPQTVVFRYARVNNDAARAGTTEFPPIPRHLLEDQFNQAGAAGIANSPLWTTDWVGLGPYRMTGRILGSQIEGAAFDHYALGRPKIDRLVVKWAIDANALVSRLLADDVDMVPNNMEPAQAAILKQQWEAAGRGTVVAAPTRLRQIQLQYRDPSLPWASDVRVRQGMLHLIDRQGLVDAIVSGMSTTGDTALLPSDPAYAALERRGLPRFPFDRAQGERLLDAAGWPRGADGIRRNAAGAVFRYNHANVGESDQDETLAIVDNLKNGGLSSEPDIIPEAAADQNERRARAHGVARPAVADATYWDRFLTAEISSSDNRWRGANTGGYTNPDFDRLVDQWRATLDPNALTERTAELHKFLVDQLIALPLYYQVEIYAWRKGVTGPGAFAGKGRNATADIHTWTLD